MNDLQQLLSDGWQVLKSAIQTVRTSSSDPDEVQLELYALAFGYASLEASNAVVASFIRNRDSLDTNTRETFEGLAQVFVADSVHRMAHEVSSLLPSEANSLSQSSLTGVQAYLSSRNLVRVGELLRARGTMHLPDFLGEEVDAMRSSVRRLTDERIVPHAQHIHRENLTVPDSIVRHIRDLGCFGMSVPTEYGGTRDIKEQRCDRYGRSYRGTFARLAWCSWKLDYETRNRGTSIA